MKLSPTAQKQVGYERSESVLRRRRTSGLAPVFPLRGFMTISFPKAFSSVEQRTGDFLVDVGYDVPAFRPGKETLFNAVLIAHPGKADWAYANADRARLEIAKDGARADQKEIPLEMAEPAYAAFTFPSAGRYQLAARFFHKGALVAEASFPIPVDVGGGFTADPQLLSIIAIVALAAVLAGVCLLPRRSRPPAP